MVHTITISDYIRLKPVVSLIDVRTPAEFAQGHIPGAFNVPLFSNEERVAVGTTYKKQGREQAILLGFELTGHKWAGYIKQALEIAPNKKIAVHCWRGGMRSGSMAWALDLYGFEVYLISGGYKTYRTWALDQFNHTFQLRVLGGKTGAQKTKLLKELYILKEQVVDLEQLAQHQGSSYGTLNRMVQPTQEQFENDLAYLLSQFDPQKAIWVEDESLTIGKRCIPHGFFNQMRNTIVICLNVPLEQRIAALVEEYGSLEKDFLIACTERIRKRLGPEQTKNAIIALEEGRMADFIRLVVYYYDKTYLNGLAKRNKELIFPYVTGEQESLTTIAQQLIDFANTISAKVTV
ncbi:tRNA 2-selenouridine(34) synthase MnmH [Pedobacter sp.]|uniref:tRNA 2-selenouridine(34) synthase MnmH n=1 Tax=Pedobacter sp. TaxID=1411316 RepID=UPI003D7F427D